MRARALTAVVVAVVACVPSASAAGARAGAAAADGLPTADQPYRECSDTDGVPFATGLPPLPCLPSSTEDVVPTRWQDFGAPFDDITQAVARPRITLQLPLMLGRTFFTVCTLGPASPCPDGFDVPIPDDPAIYGGWTGVAATVYLQSPLGDPQQYGDFAPVRTALLGFGAVPAEATVTIAQRVVDGTVTPLTLAWASSELVPAGTTYPDFPDYPPAPYPTSQFYPEAHVTGPITVTVSDVTVDGVPLDVGTTCRTATTLDLTAPGGWTSADDYVPTRGEPGAYNPVAGPPSYLTARVDLPAFTGCRSATQDVSALVTGLVSGPGNVLDVTQTQGLLPYACLPAFTDTCYGQHPPVIDPRDLPPVPAR